jgi:hypothetical protein
MQPGKVIELFVHKLKIKTGFSLFLLFIPGIILSQSQRGKILSGETNSGIGYVNIGIIGRNIGTVANEAGNFTLILDKIYNDDSLRFSMIGYESKTLPVSQFNKDSVKYVYLKPVLYNLQEVKIIYHKPREIKLGTEVVSNDLRSGFAYNDLSSELGIKLHVKGLVKLEDIDLNVAICTYDSVTYRLNIYQSDNQVDYKNIMTVPVYITFSKDKINNVITLDLRKYSILIEGNVIIALELYKDLGEGRLLFHTEYFTGYTYHRKAIEGSWTAAPGVIGMYLHGQLIK